MRWSAQGGRFCGDQSKGVRIYCHPRYFEGLPNRLYRNRGDGTFEDVSAASGIASHVGKGMSIAFADYDHDGDMDAFVTNDTVPNFLFRNNGDGTFSEAALTAGVAVPESGRPISGHGHRLPGLRQRRLGGHPPDGHLQRDLPAVSQRFQRASRDVRGRDASSGIGRLSARLSGWCSVMADVDNDGDKDLFTANSHPNDRIERSEGLGWQQSNSLFDNDGKGRFRDATVESGLGDAVAVHRGCAIADFDADGRSDIVVLVLGGQAELWHNESANGNAWLAMRPDRHPQQPGRHRRQGHVAGQVRTMTTAVATRLLRTQACISVSARAPDASDGAGRMAVGREAGGRGCRSESGCRDQRGEMS